MFFHYINSNEDKLGICLLSYITTNTNNIDLDLRVMSDIKSTHDESDILFKIIVKRYGDRLSSAELEEVQKSVERITEIAKSLKSVNLKNSDEPFFTFKPYRR
jgi:hypothetical protein